MAADNDMLARLERIERLLEERNALAREALAGQREALVAQREALAETREIAALSRANIERAGEVNQQAALVARSARKLQLALLPVLLLLIGYVSWLLFFKLRL